MQTQPLDANLCTISKSQEKGFLADFFFKHLFCLVFKAFIYLFKLSFVRLRSLFFLFMSCISPSLPIFLRLPLIFAFLGAGSRFLGVVLMWISVSIGNMITFMATIKMNMLRAMCHGLSDFWRIGWTPVSVNIIFLEKRFKLWSEIKLDVFLKVKHLNLKFL